jgi:hypothetical protein
LSRADGLASMEPAVLSMLSLRATFVVVRETTLFPTPPVVERALSYARCCRSAARRRGPWAR